jgi:hypothetical protein
MCAVSNPRVQPKAALLDNNTDRGVLLLTWSCRGGELPLTIQRSENRSEKWSKYPDHFHDRFMVLRTLGTGGKWPATAGFLVHQEERAATGYCLVSLPQRRCPLLPSAVLSPNVRAIPTVLSSPNTRSGRTPEFPLTPLPAFDSCCACGGAAA